MPGQDAAMRAEEERLAKMCHHVWETTQQGLLAWDEVPAYETHAWIMVVRYMQSVIDAAVAEAVKARDDWKGLYHGAIDTIQRQTARHVDELIEARREERQAWTDYVDWLSEVMAGHYTLSMIHGFTDSPELIDEGKRRRAALGYVPKSERPASAPEGTGGEK